MAHVFQSCQVGDLLEVKDISAVLEASRSQETCGTIEFVL